MGTVARFDTAGQLDTAFHGNGVALVDLGDGFDEVGGLSLQGDGKILIAGSTSLLDFAVARLLGDGPGIAVETASGAMVFDGLSTADLGGALPGGSIDVIFTIRNTGAADLSGLAATIDGADSADFSITAAPASLVTAGKTTNFTVRFLPPVLGPRSAALHIASNMGGPAQSFDFSLIGAGLTVAENWRQQFFGTHENAGNAADLADPNGNGAINLLEYALGGIPVGSGGGTAFLPQVSTGPGNRLQISFTRQTDRSDLVLTVQGSDSLTGPWTDLAQSANGAPFTVLAAGATAGETGSGDARAVTVGDAWTMDDPGHPQRFLRLQVTRP